MKLKRLFTGLLLSTVLAAGVGVLTTANKNDVKKIEAFGPRVDISFYIAYSGSYDVKVWYNAGYECSGAPLATKIAGATYNGVQVYQANIQSSSEASHYFDNLEVQLFEGSTYKGAHSIGGGWTQFTNDGKIFVYSSETWGTYVADTYQMKCGDGNYVSMSYDDGGGLPSGLIGQYSATLNIIAGQSLTFQKKSGSWTTLTPTYSGDSNNYHNGAVCVSVSSATVFLKYKTDGTYDVWVPGYTACAVIVGDAQYTTNQSGEGSSATYTTTTVYVDKTQTVQVSWNHNGIDTYLNADSTSGCFSGSAGTVTCTLTGAYIIQVHNNGYGQHNTVYIARVDSDTAKYLAKKFNSTISPICSGITGGTKALSDLQTAWGSNSSSELYKHFNGQPSVIKSYFGVSTTTTDTDILACIQRYDFIELKYGTSALPDFIGRSNGYKTTPQGAGLILLVGINSSSGTMITIISISVLSLAAVGGYFIFRKKKEN